MNEERNKQNPGGKSMLALFISQTTNFGSNKDYIVTRIEEHFKVYFPGNICFSEILVVMLLIKL